MGGFQKRFFGEIYMCMELMTSRVSMCYSNLQFSCLCCSMGGVARTEILFVCFSSRRQKRSGGGQGKGRDDEQARENRVFVI